MRKTHKTLQMPEAVEHTKTVLTARTSPNDASASPPHCTHTIDTIDGAVERRMVRARQSEHTCEHNLRAKKNTNGTT